MKTANKIRLSLEQGASEFGITRRTLTSRLRVDGILPGDDSMYAISQLAKAIYGDYERERSALVREQTEIARIKKENLLRKNIPAELVEMVWLRLVKDLRDRVQCAPIPVKVQNDLLVELAAIPIGEYFAASEKHSGDDDEVEENFPSKKHE